MANEVASFHDLFRSITHTMLVNGALAESVYSYLGGAGSDDWFKQRGFWPLLKHVIYLLPSQASIVLGAFSCFFIRQLSSAYSPTARSQPPVPWD